MKQFKVYKVEMLGYVGFAYVAADNEEQVKNFVDPALHDRTTISIDERLTANVDAPCIILDVLMHNITAVTTQ